MSLGDLRVIFPYHNLLESQNQLNFSLNIHMGDSILNFSLVYWSRSVVKTMTIYFFDLALYVAIKYLFAEYN